MQHCAVRPPLRAPKKNAIVSAQRHALRWMTVWPSAGRRRRLLTRTPPLPSPRGQSSRKVQLKTMAQCCLNQCLISPSSFSSSEESLRDVSAFQPLRHLVHRIQSQTSSRVQGGTPLRHSWAAGVCQPPSIGRYTALFRDPPWIERPPPYCGPSDFYRLIGRYLLIKTALFGDPYDCRVIINWFKDGPFWP